MARAAGPVRVQSQSQGDRDRLADLAFRLAREPQIAALEAVADWAAKQGVPPASVDGLREVIAVFAADPGAPNLDLAMRARRRRIVLEFRGAASAR